jgi:hypothetical protein
MTCESCAELRRQLHRAADEAEKNLQMAERAVERIKAERERNEKISETCDRLRARVRALEAELRERLVASAVSGNDDVVEEVDGVEPASGQGIGTSLAQRRAAARARLSRRDVSDATMRRFEKQALALGIEQAEIFRLRGQRL